VKRIMATTLAAVMATIPLTAKDNEPPISPPTSQDGWRGAEMGDKGGKKDKEKNKQQQVKKHQQEAQLKQDKVRPGNPSRSE
jgi:hypothetical protein